MQVQLKRASENWEKQNNEFQMTVADQRETQKLLKASLNVLQDFHGKKAPAAFPAQQQEPAGSSPPPGFEVYKKNAEREGVISMIQQTISDAKAMEAETRSEEDAHRAYEASVKETNTSTEAESKDIVNKPAAETDLAEAKEVKEVVLQELEQIANYDTELQQGYILC